MHPRQLYNSLLHSLEPIQCQLESRHIHQGRETRRIHREPESLPTHQEQGSLPTCQGRGSLYIQQVHASRLPRAIRDRAHTRRESLLMVANGQLYLQQVRRATLRDAGGSNRMVPTGVWHEACLRDMRVVYRISFPAFALVLCVIVQHWSTAACLLAFAVPWSHTLQPGLVQEGVTDTVSALYQWTWR